MSREDPTDPGVGSLPDAAGPVTTTVTRRVKPGHEPFYEQFLDGIIAAATAPIMTWLAMPRVTRLLRGWLYPDG